MIWNWAAVLSREESLGESKEGKRNKLFLREKRIFKVFNSVKSKSARTVCQAGEKTRLPGPVSTSETPPNPRGSAKSEGWLSQPPHKTRHRAVNRSLVNPADAGSLVSRAIIPFRSAAAAHRGMLS